MLAPQQVSMNQCMPIMYAPMYNAPMYYTHFNTHFHQQPQSHIYNHGQIPQAQFIPPVQAQAQFIPPVQAQAQCIPPVQAQAQCIPPVQAQTLDPLANAPTDPIIPPICIDPPTPLVQYNTEKNKKGVIYRSYKFTEKATKSKTTRHFRCQSHSSKQCPVRLTTYLDYILKCADYASHNHDSPPFDDHVPESISVAPSDSLTASPSDSLTAAPSDSLTAAPSDSLTATPSDSLIPTPSDSLTPAPSDSLTSAPHDSITSDSDPPPQYTVLTSATPSGPLSQYTTEKNKIGIVYCGFKFTEKATKAKTTRHFRCQSHSSMQCPARLTTYLDYTIKCADHASHNHMCPNNDNTVNDETGLFAPLACDPITNVPSKPTPAPCDSLTPLLIDSLNIIHSLEPTSLGSSDDVDSLTHSPCDSFNPPISNLEQSRSRELKFFTTEQNQTGIEYAGYRFTKHASKAKHTCLFRCESRAKTKCTARFTTYSDYSLMKAIFTQHNHPCPSDTSETVLSDTTCISSDTVSSNTTCMPSDCAGRRQRTI